MSRAARNPSLWPALLALALGAATPPPTASREVPFGEAELFFELNDTDGDLGIHALIDGEPWKALEIEGPGDRLLLEVRVSSSLRRQGLTELAFESGEPPFEELPPEEFFARFPEGVYEISGTTLDGLELESTDRLSHVLAAPPDNVQINGIPAPEDCEAGPVPVVSEPVLITWDPVTESHPEIGKPGNIKVVRYQFFVEREGVQLGVDLPPTVTEFEVPPAILALGEEFKFEIIVREASGNNTAVESCFAVE